MPEAKAIAPLEFEKPLAEFEKRLEELRKLTGKQKIESSSEISSLERKLEEARREIYGNLGPWQRVQIVRHPQRPYLLDYLRLGATEVVELGGDRAFGDDHALIGGFATIGKQKVVFLGHQKGRDTKENLMRKPPAPFPAYPARSATSPRRSPSTSARCSTSGCRSSPW